MVSMSELPTLAITFVLVAALFVAGFLVVAGLNESITDSNASTTTTGEAIVGNVSEGMSNVVSYAPVWGTIIGVAVLLSIVIGGFAFSRNKGLI